MALQVYLTCILKRDVFAAAGTAGSRTPPAQLAVEALQVKQLRPREEITSVCFMSHTMHDPLLAKADSCLRTSTSTPIAEGSELHNRIGPDVVSEITQPLHWVLSGVPNSQHPVVLPTASRCKSRSPLPPAVHVSCGESRAASHHPSPSGTRRAAVPGHR